MQTKLIFIAVFIFFADFVNGQYIPRIQSFPYPSSLSAQSVVSGKAKLCQNKVFITWHALGDTADGYFALFKSNGYGPPYKTVSFTSFSSQPVVDVPIMYSAIDTSYDEQFNVYHLIKLHRGTFVVSIENEIMTSPIATFVLFENECLPLLSDGIGHHRIVKNNKNLTKR